MGACAGIRVLDFTTGWAGPMTSSILAIMGAEVIKVETRSHPDFTRLLPDPFSLKLQEDPLFFRTANLSKLGITLNLRTAPGLGLAKKLVGISDVVIQSFRPGVMDRLGLSYEAVRTIKPDIIMLSSSACGQDGPEAAASGYASLFCAAAGVGNMAGYPDGPPANLRGQYDTASGFTSAFAVLAALVYRQRTGKGQYIDFSSREAIACLIGDSFLEYGMNETVRSRSGNRDDVMAPHNCYRCRGEDKWISIAVGTEEEWAAFCRALGNPRWTEAPGFADFQARRQNEDELDRLVETWTLGQTLHGAMHVLQQHGVAAVPSFSAPDLFSDPHVQQRGVFFLAEHPRLGTRYELGYPWLTSTPERDIREAPTLGEHNQYVFGELLGLSAGELAEMEKQGAFY